MRTILAGGLAALIALSASACGRMGELAPPSARETERAPRDANAPDLIDPSTVNRPASEVPIDGTASSPF